MLIALSTETRKRKRRKNRLSFASNRRYYIVVCTFGGHVIRHSDRFNAKHQTIGDFYFLNGITSRYFVWMKYSFRIHRLTRCAKSFPTKLKFSFFFQFSLLSNFASSLRICLFFQSLWCYETNTGEHALYIYVYPVPSTNGTWSMHSPVGHYAGYRLVFAHSIDMVISIRERQTWKRKWNFEGGIMIWSFFSYFFPFLISIFDEIAGSDVIQGIVIFQ